MLKCQKGKNGRETAEKRQRIDRAKKTSFKNRDNIKRKREVCGRNERVGISGTNTLKKVEKSEKYQVNSITSSEMWKLVRENV